MKVAADLTIGSHCRQTCHIAHLASADTYLTLRLASQMLTFIHTVKLNFTVSVVQTLLKAAENYYFEVSLNDKACSY